MKVPEPIWYILCMKKTHLKDLSKKEVLEFLDSRGEKTFRLRQLMLWMYRKRIGSFNEMTNIKRGFIDVLKEHFILTKLKVHTIQKSSDGSVKFAFSLEDGGIIESVIIPDGKRITACLSTQLGCALGCRFCATGAMGYARNLKIGEITGQLIALNDYLAKSRNKVSHIVFMGMGEPLNNYRNLLHALEYINDDVGFVISPHRITVSTVGIVPRIKKLADDGNKVGLAVSLNGTRDSERVSLMPVAGKYPVEAILKAAKYYFRKTGEKVTFEYLMIKGINMDRRHVSDLRRIVHGNYCKLNFIAYNPVTGVKGLERPSQKEVEGFLEQVYKLPAVVTFRKSRGRDIKAACGMLRADAG
jgi:23S rRNA (adenine2503-C2)-methyltransferase